MVRATHGVLVCWLLLMAACNHEPPAGPTPSATASGAPATQPIVLDLEHLTPADFVGVYATPQEISGFSGSVIAVEEEPGGSLKFREWSYSDVVYINPDGPPEPAPDWKVSGRVLERRRGVNSEKYTLAVINNHVVLMREDAWKVYQEQGKLYDYGILIRVAAKSSPELDLKTVRRLSIKLLYSDPTKPWRDPFVGGPNG